MKIEEPEGFADDVGSEDSEEYLQLSPTAGHVQKTQAQADS